MEGTMAEIRGFAGNFAPRNWAFCEGQLLSIAQNQALFSLLGTTYGGDGRTTFGLPDLRGRTMIGPGTGPGLTTRRLGQRSGTETNTMTTNTMPSHSHAAEGHIVASNVEGTTSDPTGAVPANATYVISRSDKAPINSYGAAGNVNMATNGVTVTIGNAGGQQPINNMQPWLGIYYVICMQGIFPSRN